MPTIFITGIDTDVGKTVATGLFARYLAVEGKSVITQKLVQTGCCGFSEDIRYDRQLMGLELQEVDRQGLTCPFMFRLPASPHLAASQEQQEIDPETASLATRQLEERYAYVLLEGAGGIYVPLTETMTTLDYICQQRYPVVIVSSARLGSINHTLLTLESARQRGLDVLGILYNCFPAENPLIVNDSQHVFATFLQKFGYNDAVIPIPRIDVNGEIPMIDFSALFRLPQ